MKDKQTAMLKNPLIPLTSVCPHNEGLAQDYSNLIFQEGKNTDLLSQFWCQYEFFYLIIIELY